ncbi:MAG TPA: sigma factor, partial [Xanthomonadales bacterium]|nr:sigma factor [Xanthomonadales bacterium]
MAASEFHSRIDALWRVESARIVAALARVVRDVALAEELAHDALVAALEQWPAQGMPDNPAAWLMASARHRAIDAVRHRAMQERKAGAIAIELESALDDAALARDEA